MKSLVKVVAVLCLASVCAGYAYASYNAEPNYRIEKRTFVERVHSGDTLNGILEQYYDSKIHGDKREWKYDILHLPQNKHLLNQNGYLKPLQVGDKVTIVTDVRVEK